jgi:hypothetical protein
LNSDCIARQERELMRYYLLISGRPQPQSNLNYERKKETNKEMRTQISQKKSNKFEF